MGELVELYRKGDGLTVEEVLALAQRADHDEVLIVGFDKENGISIWVSDMDPTRANWLAAKANAATLRNS